MGRSHPTPTEFEAIVQDVMDALPGWLHEALEHLEIRVADEPGDESEPGEEDLLGQQEQRQPCLVPIKPEKIRPVFNSNAAMTRQLSGCLGK